MITINQQLIALNPYPMSLHTICHGYRRPHYLRQTIGNIHGDLQSGNIVT
jgi:hypothetical protein